MFEEVVPSCGSQSFIAVTPTCPQLGKSCSLPLPIADLLLIFNIILAYTSRSLKRSVSMRYLQEDFLCVICLSIRAQPNSLDEQISQTTLRYRHTFLKLQCV
jgi:hypothetical protein